MIIILVSIMILSVVAGWIAATACYLAGRLLQIEREAMVPVLVLVGAAVAIITATSILRLAIGG